MTIEAGKKVYIGDGVHAYHDGYQIWLETERFDGIWGDQVHSIALDPRTFQTLFLFGQQVGGQFDLTTSTEK